MKIRILTYEEISKKINIPINILLLQYKNSLSRIHESYMGKIIDTKVYDNGDAILTNDICLEKHEWEKA